MGLYRVAPGMVDVNEYVYYELEATNNELLYSYYVALVLLMHFAYSMIKWFEYPIRSFAEPEVFDEHTSTTKKRRRRWERQY